MVCQGRRFAETAIAEGRLFYCASSLFSPLERIGGLHLAQAVERKIQHLLPGLSFASRQVVFLPFRDTDQESIEGVDRSRRIYELDMDRLRRSACLLARVDGLAKDSGVLMELGYACGLDLATGVLQTDFIWEGTADHSLEWQFDPVLDHLVDVRHLWPYMAQDKSYESANIRQENAAVETFVESCFRTFGQQRERLALTQPANEGIYVDLMGGRYGWAIDGQEALRQTLGNLGLGVFLANRYSDLASLGKVRENAKGDILSALRARVAIFSGDAPEMDAGSAVLLGLCKARGCKIILIYSSSLCYRGAGQQVMRVNLMIDQAADTVVSNLQEAAKAAFKYVAAA